MKITILQQDIVWGVPTSNRQQADEAINRNPGSDLYLLPEMFSTGFCTDPTELAETEESETLLWMKHKATASGAAIAGSLAIKEREQYYNRFYFVKPGGKTAYYDKRHLFTYGNEHLHFTAGTKRVVVEWCGVRILLATCYDLRFPVWSRWREDYDMILYTANWPTSRITIWKTLLTARAIENQCYVAGANRVGSDPLCDYSGESIIIDPYGRPIALCPSGKEAEVTAQVDLNKLYEFRQKFPVLKDRDHFTYYEQKNNL